MKTSLYLSKFLNAEVQSNQLSPIHIGLYAVLLHFWEKTGFKNPVSVSRDEMMNLSKIQSRATYYNAVRKLDELGFIKYSPSFNPFKESRFWIKKPRQLTGESERKSTFCSTSIINASGEVKPKNW